MSDGWISETWDRVVASDPGLHRLRMALSAAVAMASTLAVEYWFARLTHAGTEGVLVAMLLGTVMAMLGSMALGGGAAKAWTKVRTAVFFPVAIGAGMLPGVAVVGHTDAMLVVFVAVMFLAVFIRRFGMDYFFYGFMIWMGYFFAAFLDARLSQLPSLIEAVAVATAWVLLLSLTVLRTHPRRTLARVRRAFGARARAVARACADLLEAPADDERRRARLRRRLHSRQLRLAETALVIEGWSADPGALPSGWSAPALRRRLLDAHLAIEELASAAEALALTRGRLADEAARITGHLARHEYRQTAQRARALLVLDQVAGQEPPHGQRAPGWDCYAEHLAAAALEFTAVAERDGTVPDADEADDTDEFLPAVSLAMGALPGSGAVALDVVARSRWNPLGSMPLTTRQAIQVAVAGTLAILAGRELSQARYYWAVIAAFIAFAGTATRSETFIKAGNRVLGTLLGLGAGIGLVHLTAGHTLWVLAAIVASMSCGFYLVNITYAGMIFFVTIMVSQLYSQLGEFTDHLLVLRLEETALGAAIGVLVALVVLPTSTRDTVQAARGRYFTALADLLRATALRLDHRPTTGTAEPDARATNSQAAGPQTMGPQATGDLDALTRALDLRLQQLALVARPLTRSLARPLIWGNDPRVVRHRITLYADLTRQIRALAMSTRRAAGPAPDAALLARACAALADAALALADTAPQTGRPALTVSRPLDAAEAVLLRLQPTHTDGQPPTAARPLTRLRQLLRELAVLSPVLATPTGPAAGLTAGSDPATAVLPLPSQQT